MVRNTPWSRQQKYGVAGYILKAPRKEESIKVHPAVNLFLQQDSTFERFQHMNPWGSISHSNSNRFPGAFHTITGSPGQP